MIKFLRKYWLTVAVASFLVAIAAFGIWLNSSGEAEEPVSWGWNGSVDNVAVDSSGLRIAYRYTLDADSYHPLYSSTPAGCTILGSTTYPTVEAGSFDEEAYTASWLEGRGLTVAGERNLTVDNEAVVPFKMSAVQETDAGYSVEYARFFSQSGVLVSATVTCVEEARLNEAANAVEDAFRLTQNSSIV